MCDCLLTVFPVFGGVECEVKLVELKEGLVLSSSSLKLCCAILGLTCSNALIHLIYQCPGMGLEYNKKSLQI